MVRCGWPLGVYDAMIHVSYVHFWQWQTEYWSLAVDGHAAVQCSAGCSCITSVDSGWRDGVDVQSELMCGLTSSSRRPAQIRHLAVCSLLCAGDVVQTCIVVCQWIHHYHTLPHSRPPSHSVTTNLQPQSSSSSHPRRPCPCHSSADRWYLATRRRLTSTLVKLLVLPAPLVPDSVVQRQNTVLPARSWQSSAHRCYVAPSPASVQRWESLVLPLAASSRASSSSLCLDRPSDWCTVHGYRSEVFVSGTLTVVCRSDEVITCWPVFVELDVQMTVSDDGLWQVTASTAAWWRLLGDQWCEVNEVEVLSRC